jgi:hypothetical protein
MITYGPAPNISINADKWLEGFLGLSWFPSGEARSRVRNYESEIVRLLNDIRRTNTGWVLLEEIRLNGPRTLEIQPWPFTNLNADAGPANNNWADATLKGNQPHSGVDGSTMKDKPEGTGRGASAVVRFSAGTWGAPGGPTSPGSTGVEVLFHEMTHALRFMSGRALCLADHPVSHPGWNPKFDTDEEFVAILMTNMFISEEGKTSLRGDHSLNSLLPADLTDPQKFFTLFSSQITGLFIENRRFCGTMAAFADRVPFNPLKFH